MTIYEKSQSELLFSKSPLLADVELFEMRC